MTTTTPETTYEYPGYLVIHAPHDGGDVVIGADGDDWLTCAYRAAWVTDEDGGVPIGCATARIGFENDEDERITRANALGTATVEPHEAGSADVFVRLPGGSCVLITRGHVFTYWCDDGGACTGIVHRIEDGGGECDSVGCDDRLIA